MGSSPFLDTSTTPSRSHVSLPAMSHGRCWWIALLGLNWYTEEAMQHK